MCHPYNLSNKQPSSSTFSILHPHYLSFSISAIFLLCSMVVEKGGFNLQVVNMHEHLSSDRLIGHHRSREDYVQSPVNSLQFGYGDHRYSKMTYELLREDDTLKIKTLKQLIEDFSLCENINLALLSSDLLTVVLGHLRNKNDTVRLLSATLTHKISASPLGRKTIIKRNCIEEFQGLIHDPLPSVKHEAYCGLIDFAEFTEGINCILEKGGILVQLVDKLVEEKTPEILLLAVELLKILMQGEEGTPRALKTEIISRLMALISHPHEQIQYNVCLTLANISFNEQGKAAIVGKGHIATICPYVASKHPIVREAACLLLCSLAQLNQGKIEILQHCPFASIEALLTDGSATVLNAVQLIANIAENPKGRALASQIESKLDGIKNIERKYVDQTLAVIRWQP